MQLMRKHFYIKINFTSDKCELAAKCHLVDGFKYHSQLVIMYLKNTMYKIQRIIYPIKVSFKESFCEHTFMF